MLGLRFITASLGIPVILALVYLGGWVLLVGVGVLSTLGLFEVHKMFQQRGILFFPRLGAGSVWVILLLSVWQPRLVLIGVVATVAVISAVTMFLAHPRGFQAAVTTTWAALYVGLFFSFLLAIRALPHGRELAMGFFLVIWVTDSMAFFFGRRWGRKKLLPRISPGKTWVGTIGGTASATVVAAGMAWVVHLPWWQGAVFGAVISVTGQIGDLLESHLKRYSGVKDSGDLLPGHGGVLDRFDSALFALPFAYYLLRGLGIS